MSDHNVDVEVLPVKDSSNERPIPTAWRPILRKIASSLCAHDYQLKTGVASVEVVSPETALHIQNYIQSYGATLVDLPEESWASSVCIWSGSDWEALVDLWTQEESRSDLVLSLRVTEVESGFSFKIYMVYVP